MNAGVYDAQQWKQKYETLLAERKTESHDNHDKAAKLAQETDGAGAGRSHSAALQRQVKQLNRRTVELLSALRKSEEQVKQQGSNELYGVFTSYFLQVEKYRTDAQALRDAADRRAELGGGGDTSATAETNLTYLKNVILKFMCAKVPESAFLKCNIAALLCSFID